MGDPQDECKLKLGTTPEWCWNMVELCKAVMKGGYPNAWGARIPVYSKWNIPLLREMLHRYHDQDVVEWLTYGWPVSRPPNWKDPTPSYTNHTSAVSFPEDIEKYINKELDRGGSVDPSSR